MHYISQIASTGFDSFGPALTPCDFEHHDAGTFANWGPNYEIRRYGDASG